MITLKLLLWFIPIAINVYWDRNGRKPNYLQMFILRAMAAVFHWTLFVRSPEQWPLLVWLIVFECTSWWLFFELGSNIVQNKPSLLHYDFTEGDSGWIDGCFRLLYRKTGTHAFHWLAKFLCFLLMVYSIMRIYVLD